MDEKYFVEVERSGTIKLYEKDGTFYDHNDQDLLIAEFQDEEKAEMICEILNDKK